MTPKRIVPLFVRVVSTGCLAFASVLIGCGQESTPELEMPLVGSWIRVYPPKDALDTLVLRANGDVVGSTRGIGAVDFSLARWKIGHRLMPGGLCIGDGTKRVSCMGFVVSGDTLWLANGLKTVHLRLPGDGRRTAIQVWDSPKGNAAAPAPGGSVSPPPAGFTKKGAT